MIGWAGRRIVTGDSGRPLNGVVLPRQSRGPELLRRSSHVALERSPRADQPFDKRMRQRHIRALSSDIGPPMHAPGRLARHWDRVPDTPSWVCGRRLRSTNSDARAARISMVESLRQQGPAIHTGHQPGCQSSTIRCSTCIRVHHYPSLQSASQDLPDSHRRQRSMLHRLSFACPRNVQPRERTTRVGGRSIVRSESLAPHHDSLSDVRTDKERLPRSV